MQGTAVPRKEGTSARNTSGPEPGLTGGLDIEMNPRIPGFRRRELEAGFRHAGGSTAQQLWAAHMCPGKRFAQSQPVSHRPWAETWDL